MKYSNSPKIFLKVQPLSQNNIVPYAEIRASLQQEPFWSIVVFVVVVIFSVWLYSKYCEQMIIDENQLSHYYNILRTTTTN